LTQEELLIYPNPSNGIFNIEMPAFIEDKFNISVFNSLGQVIFQTSKTNSQEVFSLDLQDEPVGVYFIQMKTQNKIFSAKASKF